MSSIDNVQSKKEENRLPEPYELFRIECGDGWSELINPLFKWIEDYNNEHPDDIIEIYQVKEKFGGLRFYVSHEPPELKNMIQKAEDDSYAICECCGTKQDVGITLGWIRTICRKCLQEEVNNSTYKDEIKWRSNSDLKLYTITKEKK